MPLPEWPTLTVPGFALASASALFMSGKRLSARVTIIVGTVVSRLIGANSGTIDGLPAM